MVAYTLTVEDRRAIGREARKQVPRSSFGDWSPPEGRASIIDVFAEQESHRLPELIPIRHERMAASPFAFYRGAANLQAMDIAGLPRTGLTVQLCGDAHLANFGAFASPERLFVFDINDYDETLPGPFEWDVMRLVGSFEIAARAAGMRKADRTEAVAAVTRSYAAAMAELAGLGNLEVWYMQMTVEKIAEQYRAQASAETVARFQKGVRKGKTKDNLKALRKLTTVVDGQLQFLSQPPLLVPAREVFPEDEHDLVVETIRGGLKSYRSTLQRDRRTLLDRYRMVDLARKVVGVGSVGTRCWVALLVGRDNDDPLFLQVKEAQDSVLAPYLGKSVFAQNGQRVVQGQKLIQASSDIFLGWDRVLGSDGKLHDYYFRQLWDWKTSVDVETMAPPNLQAYAEICGATLARGHARTGDAIAISSYLGTGRSFGSAMSAFAVAYADHTEHDHRTFVEWRNA